MSCGIKRILQFNDIMILGPLRVFDLAGQDITTGCMYSWSPDMVCWTGWTDYNTYLRSLDGIEEDMYLRVLLFGSFGKISINGMFTTCYTICLDQSNPFLQDFCGNENMFNPYANLDCALQLQQQISDSIFCMFGIPVYYFRVKPNPDTADYTFKEYVLHNVESVKQIRLLIPDGEMPSSNPKFTALDFDWQVDWDVEMSKSDFARAFGDDAFPNVRDFIYIPMMRRMWDVNAAYDEKNENLMWKSTTWKLSLIKYEDSTNTTIPDSLDQLIDNWTVNDYDDVFGRKEEIEQDRQSGYSQVQQPTHASTNLYDISMEDAIRKSYTKNQVSIINYQYNHRSNIVARNLYKFKDITDTEGNIVEHAQLRYQKGYCGPDGMLSFILQTQGLETTSKNIIEFGPIQVQLDLKEDMYNLQFNGMSTQIKPFSSYLVILRWNHQTFSTSMDVYEYIHREDLPKYLLRPEMYWFNEEPVYSGTSVYNDDFNTTCREDCIIQPCPCMIANIKLYNRDLGLEGAIKESIKYTTNHKACVMNDVVRPWDAGHGYAIK